MNAIKKILKILSVISLIIGIILLVKFDVRGEKQALNRLIDSRDNVAETYNRVTNTTPALQRFLGGSYSSSVHSLDGIINGTRADITRKTVSIICCFMAAIILFGTSIVIKKAPYK